MKTIKTFFAAAAAACLASCTAEVSDVTKISGTVPEGITDVAVVVGTALDTLVPVTDGRFAIDVPTDLTVLSVISAEQYSVSFIADGTPLTVVLDETSDVTSEYPKISVQEKLNAFNKAEEGFGTEFGAKRQEIMSDSTLTPDQAEAKFMDFYDEFSLKYREHNINVAKDNSDNFVALYALQNLRGDAPDETVLEIINGLDVSLQQHRFVKGLKQSIEARNETAPGKMFKDFKVNTVVGQTRSIPPQPKYAEVRLSDYVGNGKFILLDFWAPWCGPCKRGMPDIKKVYETYGGKNFDVVSVAVWERQPVEVTIETAEKLGMVWNQINNAGSEPADIYGVEAIPHLILFGPDGTILARGFHGAEEIESVISEHIK